MPALDHSAESAPRFKRLLFLQILLILLCVPLGRPVQGLIRLLLQDYRFLSFIALALCALTGLYILIFAIKCSQPRVRTLLAALCTSLAILIFCYCFIVEPIEWTHLLLYGVLSFLACAMCEAQGRGLQKYTLALLISVAVSVLDETLQGIHPQRVFDLRDLILDLCGTVLGLACVSVALKSSPTEQPI